MSRLYVSQKNLPITPSSNLDLTLSPSNEVDLPTFTPVFGISNEVPVSNSVFNISNEIPSPDTIPIHKCCICLRGNIPSTNLVGCKHPVCTECVNDLDSLNCPECRQPLAQMYDYSEESIASNLISNAIDEEFRQRMLNVQSNAVDPETEDINELYTKYFV